MHINNIVAVRRSAPAVRNHRAAAQAVQRFAVFRKPFSGLAQAFYLLLIHFSRSVRADIQQIIAVPHGD